MTDTDPPGSADSPNSPQPPNSTDQPDPSNPPEPPDPPGPIELRDVTKTYGPTPSLREVSLTFEPGAVHGLLGPNGAGKTTLFRLLLGLTSPDSGTVTVPDVDVGCAFQDPQCYADLTVAQNLEVFATLGGNGSDGAWTEHLIDACGLDRVRDRPAGELSAGFTKRLDLALALQDRPEVVLLDEPLADIDDEHRRRVVEVLEAYGGPDRQLVVATHQFEWFTPLFDDVTVLVGGRVRAREDAATLRDRAGGVGDFYTRVVREETAPTAGSVEGGDSTLGVDERTRNGTGDGLDPRSTNDDI